MYDIPQIPHRLDPPTRGSLAGEDSLGEVGQGHGSGGGGGAPGGRRLTIKLYLALQVGEGGQRGVGLGGWAAGGTAGLQGGTSSGGQNLRESLQETVVAGAQRGVRLTPAPAAAEPGCRTAAHKLGAGAGCCTLSRVLPIPVQSCGAPPPLPSLRTSLRAVLNPLCPLSRPPAHTSAHARTQAITPALSPHCITALQHTRY